MANSTKNIVLEFKRGKDKSSVEGNGRFQIRYSSLPRLSKTNLDKLFGQFIEMAPQLLGVDTTTASVRTLTQQSQKEGQKLYRWLLKWLPELKPVLADLSADHRLILHGDDGIMALPWELLFDGKRFLFKECPLIRKADKVNRLPAGFNTAEAQLPLPLRVLGISYSSLGLNVDPDGHWELVQDSLQELTDRRLAHLRLLNEDELFDFLDFANLPEDIQDVSILHILAHGTAPDDKGDVKINLGGKEYSGEQLADIIIERLATSGKNPNLRLVIMASCKSDRRNKSGLVKPVTQAMLKKGVPAVVSMQYDISLDAAAYFVVGIYRELANGEPLDVATQGGRFETNRLSGTIEWATPVLYTILDDLALFAPLIPHERQIRQEYLATLRATTPYIKEFFPIQVVAVDSEDSTNAQSSKKAEPSRVASMRTNQGATLQRRLEAKSLLHDDSNQLRRRTTILLGDTGGGKSAIIDQFLWNLIPASEEGELSPALREYAYHPASYIPIRLSLKRVGTDEYNYRLRSLVRQSMAKVWSMRPDNDQTLPSEQEVSKWAEGKWTFLIILEDLQSIPDGERQQVSLYLYNLIQRNPQHYFILTGTTDSFIDFSMNLGQFPQWKTVALPTRYIRDYIERENLPVEDEGLIDLVRQPWAFGTLKAMVNQGQVAFSQASLLQGRIDHQLNQMSGIREFYLSGRVRQTLIKAARTVKESGDTALSTDDLFALMKEIQGERTYNLENLFAALIRDGILTAVEQNGTQYIQFREAYIFAILYALAMTDVLPEHPDFVATYDHHTPDARLALILMAQLDDNNMQLIVLGLMKRLREPSLRLAWPARLDLLDLVVNCAGAKFGQLKQPLRVKIIQELSCCILPRQEISRFKKWLQDQSFTEIPTPLMRMNLNGKRLTSSELRTHVLELLAATKAPQAYEILRWFIMEPVQWRKPDEPPGRLADSKMRQKALQLFREQWQLAQNQPDSLLLQFLAQEALQPLTLLIETWNEVRQQSTTAELTGFNLLKEWLLDETISWHSSVTAVSLADVGARQPAWTEQTTTVLVEQFLNTTNEDAVWLISESLTLLSYLPAENEALQEIKRQMTEIALQKPEKADDSIGRLRQMTAVDTLGRLKVANALETLVEILGSDEQDFRVRARSAWAIGRICAEYPQHPLLYKARTALMEAAKTTFNWPQHEAIKALGLCYPDETSKALLIEIKASLLEGEMNNEKKYVINLIDQTIPKCDVKSKPGVSLSYKGGQTETGSYSTTVKRE